MARCFGVFRVFVLVIIISCVKGTFSGRYRDLSWTLQELSRKVFKEQIPRTQQYRDITHLEELEGIYRNYIHINLRGKQKNAFIRRNLGLLDNNPFISGIVALQILDAYRFGHAPMPPTKEIERIVKVYSDSHEMNTDYDTSVMLFFQQRYNPKIDFWQTYPTNIIRVFQGISKLPKFLYQFVLNALLGPDEIPEGLGNLFSAKQIADRMRIPGDFDSSSTHICFGSILYQLREKYPSAWRKWRNRNSNLTSVFDAVKRYAYRPFSNNSNINSIDTRSYFYLRKFLDAYKTAGKDLAIIPTWAMSIDDEREQYKKGISMPWGVNVIDMTVIANFLAGVFSALDIGLINPQVVKQDKDLNLILDSSSTLMTYFLQHNLTDRPDLSLTYYPTTVEFYWFVARGLFYMENAKHRNSLSRLPVYEKYYTGLSKVMRVDVSKNILAMITSHRNGIKYVDGFLGKADYSFIRRPKKRAEDRYYSTTMAANSLIYSWTWYDVSSSSLRWIQEVPREVKQAVYGLSKWLRIHPFGGRFGVRNAFFSVSEKNRETIPLWYPSNRYEFLNGTKIEGFHQIPEELTIFGMEGYVNPREYRHLLKTKQFGVNTMNDFQSYNSGQGAVIFWNCDAAAYASTLITLSMADSLQRSDH